MRTLNADQVLLQIDHLPQLHLQDCRPQTNSKDSQAPVSSRIKKVRIEFVDERAGSYDYSRFFQQLSVCCPNLECFELVHSKHCYEGWSKGVSNLA